MNIIKIIFCYCLPVPIAMSVRKTIVLSTIQQNLICTPDNKGMADLITIAAFKRAAVNLEIDDIPAKRPLINANHGIYDGDLATITGVTKRYHTQRVG
jgi:hypothetical protein